MTLVGFDTSLPVTSACILRDDGAAFRTPAPPPARLVEPAAHSEELLPELQRLLDEAGTSWDEVESIAVGIGPGTFTGLRIGVATARALGQALRVPLRPVSSLEALAAGLASAVLERSAPGDAGRTPPATDRPLLPLIDARRREVFAALYTASPPDQEGPKEANRNTDAPVLAPLWEPAVLDPDQLLGAVRNLEHAPICAGDWAVECRKELEAAGAEVPAPDSGLHSVSAFEVCRLAGRVIPVPPENVRPVYLRLPDAEINRRLAREQGRSQLGAAKDGERGRSPAGADESGRDPARARD